MSPRRRLLLVIDLQVVVAPGGAWEIPGVTSVIEAVTTLARRHEGPMLASRHRPVPDEPGSVGPFARHADLAALTDDAAEVVPGLAHLPTADKHSYSALRSNAVREAVDASDEVVVCGVETDCCVLATVFDLLDAGVKTIVVKDGVLGPDDLAHRGALRALERLGDLVRVQSLEQVLGSAVGARRSAG